MCLPDVHSGYGFPIGTVAAVDAESEDAVISPGITITVQLMLSFFLNEKERRVKRIKCDMCT